jgi:hypothetical protein
MGHKGRVQRTSESEGQEMVHLWTFESREKLDKFAAILESNGVVYEIQTRKQDGAAKGSDGVVIAVRQLDSDKAKKLLMKHRKRRTSSDFT